MALRLLSRQEWEARLRVLDCRPLSSEPASDESLGTGEWWLTKNDKWFIVPCDRGGSLRLDDWQDVSVQVAKLRPLDWDT